MAKASDIEQLFKACYGAMFRTAYVLLHDEDAAKDIVHDVFESLLGSNITAATHAYLICATRNRCINLHRNRSARQRIIDTLHISDREIEEEDWPNEETLGIINATVDNDLSEACRRVVVLRYREGLSYEEICTQLDISKAAVYKHLHKAIETIRTKLKDNG